MTDDLIGSLWAYDPKGKNRWSVWKGKYIMLLDNDTTIWLTVPKGHWFAEEWSARYTVNVDRIAWFLSDCRRIS
jgi:hypothetical protein